MRIRKTGHSEVNKKRTRTHSYSRIKEHVVECGRSAKARIHKLSKRKENHQNYKCSTPYKGHVYERTPIRTRLRSSLSLHKLRRNSTPENLTNFDSKQRVDPIANNIYRSSPYPIFETNRDDTYSRPHSSDSEQNELKQIQLVKTDSLQSLKNIIKMGLEAESSGASALNMLNCQHDVLGNIDRNLDDINVYNRMANSNISQLKGYKKYYSSPSIQDDISNAITYDRYYSPVKRRMHTYDINYPYSTDLSTFEDIEEPTSREQQNSAHKYEHHRRKLEFDFSSPVDDIDSSINKALDEISCISHKLRSIARETSYELDCQLDRLSCTENAIQKVSCKVQRNTGHLDTVI